MIGKLFKSRVLPPSGPVAAIPPGRRLYAIGDIHGRLDLVEELLSLIETDNATRGDARVQLLFLGDLVDRGPDSAAVIDLVRALKAQNPDSHILMGNHEEVFLQALSGDLKALRFFIRIGGRETILSYGMSPDEYEAASFEELQAWLAANVPAAHIAFLESLEDLVCVGDYAFVHAGVRPGVPLDQQKLADLRWIRERFLDHGGPHEKVIVHGHSIMTEPEELANRIGLDTGAYASGRLTAMGFEGEKRWIIQTCG